MDKNKIVKICRIASLSSIACLIILLSIDILTDLEIPNLYAELGYLFSILEILRYSLLNQKPKWKVVIPLFAISIIVIVFIISIIDILLLLM